MLLPADLAQCHRDHLGRDAGEVVPLAPRQDGDRNLVCLGGGEEELDVSRRLFQRLQKGVEGPGREHVHFVDIIDLVTSPAGPQRGVLPQLAHLLDPVVAGTVDLDHVDVLPQSDRLADVAGLARFLGRPLHAIQTLGEDPGHRGLADPAGTAKQICLGDPVHPDRIPQGPHNMVLTDHILKPLRPIAPGDDGVRRRISRRRESAQRSGGDSAVAATGSGLDSSPTVAGAMGRSSAATTPVLGTFFRAGRLTSLARFIVTNPEA